MAVGDFNGDGKLDLGRDVERLHSRLLRPRALGGVLRHYYTPVIGIPAIPGFANVLLGDGDGLVLRAEHHRPRLRVSHVGAVADFNSDGIDDFATVNTDYGTVSVLLGDASGYLQGPGDFYAGSYPYAVAAGDVNGDLNADLVTANLYGNDVSVLLGDGAGGFGARQQLRRRRVPQLDRAWRFHPRRQARRRHGELPTATA